MEIVRKIVKQNCNKKGVFQRIWSIIARLIIEIDNLLLYYGNGIIF